jgi:hypothetical protein
MTPNHGDEIWKTAFIIQMFDVMQRLELLSSLKVLSTRKHVNFNPAS